MSVIYDAAVKGFVAFGLGLSAAWSGLLGYAIFKLVELVIF